MDIEPELMIAEAYHAAGSTRFEVRWISGGGCSALTFSLDEEVGRVAEIARRLGSDHLT
jgi:hypothetical protein